jgi:hypothetical protein
MTVLSFCGFLFCQKRRQQKHFMASVLLGCAIQKTLVLLGHHQPTFTMEFSCTKFNIRHVSIKSKNKKCHYWSLVLDFCYEKLHKTKLCRRRLKLLTRCRYENQSYFTVVPAVLLIIFRYSKSSQHYNISLFLLDFPACFCVIAAEELPRSGWGLTIFSVSRDQQHPRLWLAGCWNAMGVVLSSPRKLLFS